MEPTTLSIIISVIVAVFVIILLIIQEGNELTTLKDQSKNMLKDIKKALEDDNLSKGEVAQLTNQFHEIELTLGRIARLSINIYSKIMKL